jgi:murein DD-endopeptidase MepM/ murein hydrolase activator NlpD
VSLMAAALPSALWFPLLVGLASCAAQPVSTQVAVPAPPGAPAAPPGGSPEASPEASLEASPAGSSGALPLVVAPLPAAPPALALLPLPDAGPRSRPLPSGLFSPMPGGLLAGYPADTGLDIAGFKRPVHAIAAGTLDYAEAGHTRWRGRGDSRFTVRLALDEPISWGNRRITHAYYGHLSSLAATQAEGAGARLHVEAGQVLGVSGWANGSPHLHLGLLLDGHVGQDSWEDILDEAQVRGVLGHISNGQHLPR